ncbi:Acg family FMN-binding oxidoreductase [Prauserella muralis]|uniref:NAD(P)H nitroreductase n=1 Tax=Prauserella muralis TaxID=588067 RepID=A0A2V4AP14_9PSEU|nr:NAD(P)H nitroreductase [Prauserella muralis]PXY22327.1 NAD(P)H nitroreductase [Prauserella muralis]TWE27979.1 hypothetical protein FHX69_0629 [Prauserella muralis]
MTRGLPDEPTIRAALALATRAPSVHNSQPWLWRVGDRTIHLDADRSRQLPQTDPEGRDLLLSCGAALHHLRVGLAALGWSCRVHRLPNPAEPDHLAAVELSRRETAAEDVAAAAAIPRRRTDRRRYSSWHVPTSRISRLAERAAAEGAVLEAITEPQARYRLLEAISTAARTHEADSSYLMELAVWSGRHDSPEGVPARSATAPTRLLDEPATRRFSDPRLAQPEGSLSEEDVSVLLVLGTASDDRMSQLRAGEATSDVLLTATQLGLACCPLTEPLELVGTRELVRTEVLGDGSYPQMIVRVGWAAVNADPLPATPRRPLADVVHGLAD